MTLPKELTTVTSLSKTLALILFILLPIIAFFLGRTYQKSISESKQLQNEIPSQGPTFAVTPSITPQALNNDSFSMVSSDTVVMLNPSLKTNLTIPKGGSYQVNADGYGIDVHLTPNIFIQMCSGCQQIALFERCGSSYGMTGEGICTARKVTLGNVIMNANVLKNDPNTLEFINGTIKALSVGIETNNGKLLTADEESTINKLLISIKTE